MTQFSKQPSLTIISVTGHSDYTQGSAYAIWRSYLALKDKITDLRCVLVSPDKPAFCPQEIQHLPCQPFSYQEYNAFVLYGLAKIVETDFALIVQNDGWVVAGENWSDEFFQYDYIGPPVPLYVEDNPIYSHTSSEYYVSFYEPIPENLYEVQNGGFSLRSKRLLNCPYELNLNYQFSVNGISEKPYRLTYKNDVLNEDVWLSGLHRPLLEKKGFRFAPRHIAMRFGIEDAVPYRLYNRTYANKITINQLFGIHCAGHITLIGENRAMASEMEFPTLESILDLEQIRMLLMQGYEVFVPAEYSPTKEDVRLILD